MLPSSSLLSLTALVLLPVLGTTPALGTTLDQERDSLEQFLERARSQEAAALEAIRPKIELRFEQLQSAVIEGRRRPIEAARSQLVELGPIAAPLLVTHLDPGDASDPDTRALAKRVSQVLVLTRPSSITEELLDIARTGTLEGRLNAVRVLAVSPEPDRARPVLAELYVRTHGALRSSSLSALARLGGDETMALLRQALSDPDGEVVAIALRALADGRALAAGDAILTFARNQERAGPNVRDLLRYYSACPELLSNAHVDALIDLASTPATRTDDRTAILDTLGRHPESVDEDDRKRIRKIAGAPAQDLHEAALVCLTILGDRSARRELLDPYVERVEKNRDWAKSYENRARILYRIGDYRDAIRDYKKALDLVAMDQRTRQEEAYVGLARCYALSGKLREAAQTLLDAPLTAAQVRALAKDPDFAELRASARYGDVFDVDRR